MDPLTPSLYWDPRTRRCTSGVPAGEDAGVPADEDAGVPAGITAGELNSMTSYPALDYSASALGEQLAVVTTHVSPIETADVLLKLCNMAGDPNISGYCGSLFTQLICRLVSDLEVSLDDIALFRRFVLEIEQVAHRALRGEKDSNGRHIMSMALVDLLRSTFRDREKEYTKTARSDQRKESCGVLKCIRGVQITKNDSDAYMTASIFDQNLHAGLERLLIMINASDAELKQRIDEACKPLARSLCALSFATLFDGQRLRTGAWICYNFVTSTNFKYYNDVNNHLSGALSNVSMQRIKSAFCIFCGLARLHIKTDVDFACCLDSPEWKALDELIHSVINWSNTLGENIRSNPSTSIATFMGYIASWFENAIGMNDDTFNNIYSAFTVPALVLHDACTQKEVRQLYVNFLNHNRCHTISIIQAAEILCEARFARGHGSMPFMTSITIVLSGIVGSWFCSRTIQGPFVLGRHAAHCTADIFTRIPDIRYTISASKANVKRGATTTGNKCASTRITRNMMDSGEVRAEHEKTNLVETRLCASFTVLSIKESLARDLPQNVTAATTEGVKNLRSVYITALRVLPGIQAVEPSKDSSSLIERCDGQSTAVASGSNVEKPWRDVCGGIIAASMLRPQSGQALLNTIELRLQNDGTEDSFESVTNHCVQQFTEQLTEDNRMMFRGCLISRNVNEAQYKRSLCVFAQQLSFVDAYCNSIKDCGLIWEQLQNSFSRAPSRKRSHPGSHH